MAKSTRGKGPIDLKAGGAKIKKNKPLMFRLPGEAFSEIDKKIKEIGLKGRQELFDYLIVSGIVFRKAEILDFLNKKIPEYRELSRKERSSRLGIGERPDGFYWDTKSMKQNNMMMYEPDYKAFQDYVIEADAKKQWIFNALFIDGFLGDVPEIIDHLKSCKKRKINSRKKAVARLTEDEYVTALPLDDAREILERNTKNYDDRNFSDHIQEYMNSIIVEKQKEIEEEEELDLEFEEKIKKLRRKRSQEIRKLTSPMDEEGA